MKGRLIIEDGNTSARQSACRVILKEFYRRKSLHPTRDEHLDIQFLKSLMMYKSPIVRKSVIGPWVGGGGVASFFPITGLVFFGELDGLEKLGAFPCVELGQEESRWASVFD